MLGIHQNLLEQPHPRDRKEQPFWVQILNEHLGPKLTRTFRRALTMPLNWTSFLAFSVKFWTETKMFSKTGPELKPNRMSCISENTLWYFSASFQGPAIAQTKCKRVGGSLTTNCHLIHSCFWFSLLCPCRTIFCYKTENFLRATTSNCENRNSRRFGAWKKSGALLWIVSDVIDWWEFFPSMLCILRFFGFLCSA